MEFWFPTTTTAATVTATDTVVALGGVVVTVEVEDGVEEAAGVFLLDGELADGVGEGGEGVVEEAEEGGGVASVEGDAGAQVEAAGWEPGFADEAAGGEGVFVGVEVADDDIEEFGGEAGG